MADVQVSQDNEQPQMSLPDQLPVVRLINGVVYPGMLTPLTVTNPLDGDLIDEVLQGDRILGLVAQKANLSAAIHTS